MSLALGVEHHIELAFGSRADPLELIGQRLGLLDHLRRQSLSAQVSGLHLQRQPCVSVEIIIVELLVELREELPAFELWHIFENIY